MKKSKEFPYVEPVEYFSKEAMEVFFPKKKTKGKERNVDQRAGESAGGKDEK